MVLRLPLNRAGVHAETRLDGPRLYLRAPQERDWADWARLREASRSFLVPWEPAWPADVLTRESFRRRIRRYHENWRTDQGYALFAFRNGDDRLLGGVTLTNLRRGVVQSANLGYWMGEPYTRKGFMRESLNLTLAFAFDRLGLHRMEAACLPHNEPSRCLLESLGFQREGLARKYLCINGQWQDHLLFGLLGEDWRAATWQRRRIEREQPVRTTYITKRTV